MLPVFLAIFHLTNEIVWWYNAGLTACRSRVRAQANSTATSCVASLDKMFRPIAPPRGLRSSSHGKDGSPLKIT